MLKEKKWLFLNQERKDKRMDRIMLKEKKWLLLNLWFKEEGVVCFEPLV